MSYSVKSRYISQLTIEETLDIAAPDAATQSAVMIHDQWNTTATLEANTSPPASKMAAFQQSLTAGVATIDMTNLLGTDQRTVNATALLIRQAKFQNPSTNSNSITIVKGASNPYLGFGSSFQLTLPPGAEALLKGPHGAISPTAKTLDISGTGTEALNVIFVFG